MRPQPSRPNLIMKASFVGRPSRHAEISRLPIAGCEGRQPQVSYINSPILIKVTSNQGVLVSAARFSVDHRPEAQNSRYLLMKFPQPVSGYGISRRDDKLEVGCFRGYLRFSTAIA